MGRPRFHLGRRCDVEYNVHIIDDDELPDEVEWAFVRQDGHMYFWLKRSTAADPEALAKALEESWETFRMIEDEDVFSWPEADSGVVRVS